MKRKKKATPSRAGARAMVRARKKNVKPARKSSALGKAKRAAAMKKAGSKNINKMQYTQTNTVSDKITFNYIYVEKK